MERSISHQMESQHSHHHPQSNRAAKIKSFVWHLLQMIVAMEVGMTLYHAVFVNLLAPPSFKEFVLAKPLFDYWIMMVAMTLPMIALMRYRRHSWSYCSGMTAAMLAPIFLLTMFVLTGLVSFAILHGSGMALMILGMALFMFLHSRLA